MAILGMALVGIGVIISLIFGIQLIILAFKESTGWGLAYLFLPFASLVFIVKFWEVCKKPFLWSLVAVVIMVVGAMMLPSGMVPTETMPTTPVPAG